MLGIEACKQKDISLTVDHLPIIYMRINSHSLLGDFTDNFLRQRICIRAE